MIGMDRMRNPYVLSMLTVFCAAALLVIGGCGSSSSSPSTTPAATITITSNTASPKNVSVPRGSQVNFVNNDNSSHNMASNPHPEHTDCPEINQVGVLNPGQSRQTGNMTTNRTVCGFHDHDHPDVIGLQGTITIQ
jgi:plastocyanin